VSDDFCKYIKLSADDRKKLLKRIHELEDSLVGDSEEDLRKLEADLAASLKKYQVESPREIGQGPNMQKNWEAIQDRIGEPAAKVADVHPIKPFGEIKEPEVKKTPSLNKQLLGAFLIAAGLILVVLSQKSEDQHLPNGLDPSLTTKGVLSGDAEQHCEVRLRGRNGDAIVEGTTISIQEGPIFITGRCTISSLLHIRVIVEAGDFEIRNLALAGGSKHNAILDEADKTPVDLRAYGTPEKLLLFVTKKPIQYGDKLPKTWQEVKEIGGAEVIWAFSYDIAEAKQ
jgi:hypothetical protein